MIFVIDASGFTNSDLIIFGGFLHKKDEGSHYLLDVMGLSDTADNKLNKKNKIIRIVKK